jgi:hypothetical protein
MSSFNGRSFVMLAGVFFAVAAGPGFAQQDPRDALAKELLDVEVSMSGAYDSDVSMQSPSTGGGQLQPPGYSLWGIGSLFYSRRSTDSQFHAAATSAVRHYPDAVSLTNQPASLTNQTHTGAIRFSKELPARLGFNLDQTVSYSPAYRYTLFPALPEASLDQPPPIPDDYYYDLDPSSSVASLTSINLTRRMTPRTILSADAKLDHTNFATETLRRPDLTSYSIKGGLTRNLNRNDRLTVSYHYRVGRFGLARNRLSDENAVEMSLNFNRQLSASQRVTFFVRAGGATVSLPDFIPDLDEATTPVDTRTVKATGEAGLLYPFARAWQIRGSVNRGMQYVAGVNQPVFVTGFSAEVTGTVKRRVGFTAHVRRSSGQSALTGNHLLDTYDGVARVGVILTRGLQAYTEYAYYGYLEDDVPDVPVVAGVPLEVERHGARAGLLLRVPAFRR